MPLLPLPLLLRPEPLTNYFKKKTTTNSPPADHIETLYELDLEIIGEMKQPGIKRAESLNGDPRFIEALADIVKRHLESGTRCSKQMPLRCPMCVNVRCEEQKVSFFL